MSDIKITAVMMDDSTIDVKKEVDMVFSIANTLRGPYKPDKYKDVIIPMIILRRLECALMQKNVPVTSGTVLVCLSPVSTFFIDVLRFVMYNTG